MSGPTRLKVDKEITALLQEVKKKLNLKSGPAPKTEKEWGEFEDLYFELRDFVKFRPNPEDLANSLSDLAMAVWFFRKEPDQKGMTFVTMNRSILDKAKEIKEVYKISVVNADIFMGVVEKEGRA